MRIIVLGAGAIGSLYGAKLAPANDVTLIARPKHVAAIESHGLKVDGIDSNIIRVRAATSIEQIETDTLILLTTKVPATSSALTPLVRSIRDDTTVLCLQNGLGGEKIARDVLGPRGVVLRGITQFGAIFVRPGEIRYMAAGYTVIEQHPRSEAIAKAFTAAGLSCRISPNIARDVWHKLVINCVVNPITTIVGRDVGAIADRQLEPLKRLVIDECLAVAATEGLTFAGDFNQQINERFAPSHNIVSMQQDQLRGRPTEIDYLNGAIVALGAARGIDCPVNRALTSIIKTMEARSHSLFPQEVLEPQLA
ncbi:MAG: ketopantoate reductase family protein [Chthoniobacterales bacterium]